MVETVLQTKNKWKNFVDYVNTVHGWHTSIKGILVLTFALSVLLGMCLFSAYADDVTITYNLTLSWMEKDYVHNITQLHKTPFICDNCYIYATNSSGLYYCNNYSSTGTTLTLPVGYYDVVILDDVMMNTSCEPIRMNGNGQIDMLLSKNTYFTSNTTIALSMDVTDYDQMKNSLNAYNSRNLIKIASFPFFTLGIGLLCSMLILLMTNEGVNLGAGALIATFGGGFMFGWFIWKTIFGWL